jgi:hypothetical protein
MDNPLKMVLLMLFWSKITGPFATPFATLRQSRQVLSGLLERRPGRRLGGGPGGAKARMWRGWLWILTDYSGKWW